MIKKDLSEKRRRLWIDSVRQLPLFFGVRNSNFVAFWIKNSIKIKINMNLPRSVSSSSIGSRSGLPRKSILPSKISNNNDEAEKMAKLDDLFERCVAIIRVNDLKIKENNLKLKQQELVEKTQDLEKKAEEYELLKERITRYKKALQKFQILKELNEISKNFEKFIDEIEPYLNEPIPVHMDNEEFETLSTMISSHSDRSKSIYEGLDDTRKKIDFVIDLNLKEKIIDVCQPEKYQQIKSLNHKCNDQIEKLQECLNTNKKLENILLWIEKQSFKIMNEKLNN
ncbi:hypothetical protein SSS_06800 [Sarcoptes scabiei]|uniref:Uncharacterized protein n=2 Tax=Sarcoptes scabiei TaxID=52283 RepID=A0A834VIS4_SARSC|nr:hypothetical protein SSS_06800 [Sarcoptes scabiei]